MGRHKKDYYQQMEANKPSVIGGQDQSKSASPKPENAGTRDGTHGKPVRIADSVDPVCSVCGGSLMANGSERFTHPMPLPDGRMLIGRRRFRCQGRCGRFSVSRWVQAKDGA